jgi:hypothetical protein
MDDLCPRSDSLLSAQERSDSIAYRQGGKEAASSAISSLHKVARTYPSLVLSGTSGSHERHFSLHSARHAGTVPTL